MGRVQGVGFRATARACAAPHAVTGWVRNEPDGSVLLEIQGEEPEIEAALASLRDRMSRLITREDAEALPPVGNESGFRIER